MLLIWLKPCHSQWYLCSVLALSGFGEKRELGIYMSKVSGKVYLHVCEPKSDSQDRMNCTQKETHTIHYTLYNMGRLVSTAIAGLQN